MISPSFNFVDAIRPGGYHRDGMNRSSLEFITLSAILACLLSMPVAASGGAEPVYRDAMRARDLEHWSLAAALFDLALQERAEEGGKQVLLYGTRWADYTPHLHLGEALFELGLYPQALTEWQESLEQIDWQRKQRRALHERYIPRFESSCQRRVNIVERRIAETRSELPRVRARVGEARPPEATPGAQPNLAASVAAAESWLNEALESLPAAGAPRLCAVVPEVADDVSKVSEALESARRLERVEALSERARSELLSVQRRLDAWRASEEQEKTARALAEIERRLEALERSPSPLRRDSGLPRPRARTAALALAGDGETADEAADAFEAYLVGLGYARAGRCQAAVEHVERAVATLGTDFEAPPGWGLDCETESASWQQKRCYRPHAALAFAHTTCPGADSTARTRRELDLALAAGELTVGWKEKIEQDLARKPAVAPYQGSSALLIGVSSYEGAWPPLVKVKEDLEALAASLGEQGVEVGAPLLDPSKTEIEEAIEAAISASGKESGQRFLFYFGGHGDTYRTRQGVTLGYIVPAGAPEPPADSAAIHRFLANEVIDLDRFFAWSRQLEVDHALFIFDSCFSGSIKNLADEDRSRRAFDPEDVKKPARIFLAAGREDQRVSATSEFREALLRSISGCADADRNGYVAASELGDYLVEIFRDRTSQTPWWGKLDDPLLSAGDAVFEVRRAPTDCPDARWERDSSDILLWEQMNELYRSSPDLSVLEIYERASSAGYFRPALEFKRQLLSQGQRQAVIVDGRR